jgi:hypothetical protein
MGRYQLIKPFAGDKIYESNNLIRGAKKCYDELKLSGQQIPDHFMVLDIDSYKKFTFKTHKRVQDGGNQNKYIEALNNLEHRIRTLESMAGIKNNI